MTYYDKIEVGKYYGRWKVLEGPVRKNGYKAWTCVCSCIKKTRRTVFEFSLKKKNSESCGCLGREKRAIANRNPDAGLNIALKTYEANARTRNIIFSLSKEEFREISSQNCHYCFTPPSKEYGGKNTHPQSKYLGNGIDRRDNDKGYDTQNSIPCCEICNHAKKNMSYTDFLNYLRRFEQSRNHNR